MHSSIENFVQQFFKKFEIQTSQLLTTIEDDCIITIKIQSEESGLLIWPHGKNLETIENLVRLLISKKLDKKIKLHIEVNDYQSSRNERLQSFITSKIQIVERSGKDLQLPFYSAYERKKIHWMVWDYWNPRIFTKSIGEQKERRLYICQKWEKLTIDIDGNDI